MIRSIFLATFLVSSIPAFADWTPEQISRRVNAHLVIGDNASACSEASWCLRQFPQSKTAWQTYIHAMAKAGDEKAMMAGWKAYVEAFPDEKADSDVLECMAWAVIDRGYASSSPLIRVMAMLGAFFSQDAKGIAILLQGLQDENSFIRGAAVKLSSHLHDAALQDELISMLGKERVWKVRLEVIKAVGELKIATSKKGLERIIANDQSHAEEKAAAIEALVTLSNSIGKKQLAKLVASNRAGFRMLACEFVAFFDQSQDIDALFPLITDHNPSVRAKVLQTLGRLRTTAIGGLPVATVAARAANDPDPVVAVTAAWVLTINSPANGMPVFQKLLNHPVRETRHLAAAALAATGKYGLPLSVAAFRDNRDQYVRMNLALGMIGQRADVAMACECLYAGMTHLKEKWAWSEEDNFRVLAPSKVKHDEEIPNHPEAVNQLTRLEVLQILAMVQYPYVQQATKSFLQESNWGITGLASALLLTEGDDQAVDVVKTLLKDPEPKVRIQAALILALWGDGEEVVQLLQEAYPEADRELKGQILEGIGRIKSRSSVTFLAEKLQEPYQTLRIISAASLLECLYH